MAINIIKGSIDTADKKAVYRMTKSRGLMVQKLDIEKPFPVTEWLLYEESKTDREGNEKIETVLSIYTGDIKVSTISKTFIREFLDIADLMDGEPFEIIVVDGENSSGRRFVSCELVCD